MFVARAEKCNVKRQGMKAVNCLFGQKKKLPKGGTHELKKRERGLKVFSIVGMSSIFTEFGARGGEKILSTASVEIHKASARAGEKVKKKSEIGGWVRLYDRRDSNHTQKEGEKHKSTAGKVRKKRDRKSKKRGPGEDHTPKIW